MHALRCIQTQSHDQYNQAHTRAMGFQDCPNQETMPWESNFTERTTMACKKHLSMAWPWRPRNILLPQNCWERSWKCMHDVSSHFSHRHFACIEIQQHLKTQKTANKSSSNTGNSNRDDNAATTIEKLIKHVTSMYTLMPLPKLAVSSSCAPYCCIWPLPAATAHRHILYVANADGPTRWTWKPGTPQTKTNNNKQKKNNTQHNSTTLTPRSAQHSRQVTWGGMHLSYTAACTSERFWRNATYWVHTTASPWPRPYRTNSCARKPHKLTKQTQGHESKSSLTGYVAIRACQRAKWTGSNLYIAEISYFRR